eukprot:2924378-Lingulodinium_polyedra.AAC.1
MAIFGLAQKPESSCSARAMLLLYSFRRSNPPPITYVWATVRATALPHHSGWGGHYCCASDSRWLRPRQWPKGLLQSPLVGQHCCMTSRAMAPGHGKDYGATGFPAPARGEQGSIAVLLL